MQQILLAILFLFCLGFSLNYILRLIEAMKTTTQTESWSAHIAIILWTLFYYFSNQ